MTNGKRPANPVGWFEIYVAEMDRAKDFYEDVVGAGFSAAPIAGEGPDAGMEMLFFDADDSAAGAPGALVRHPMRPPARPGPLAYSSGAACGAAAARATARGSKVYVEKQSIGEMGFIAIVGDSEGNSIGLHSWV
ncbi:MAG: VOC family protein [Pseudomonadota bacterium]|nr:VOC family protein [Pseudomonadota bacterium]